MKLDQFVHGDYSKLNANVSKSAREAYLGTWMNIPVHFTTNVEGSNAAGHDNALFHKSAIALIVQKAKTPHKQFDINYLATKVVFEQIYGMAEMRDDHGVFARGA